MTTARSTENKTSKQRSANYVARAIVALGIAAAGTFGSVGIASAAPIGTDRPGVSTDENTTRPKVRGPHSSAPHLRESAAAKARKAHIPHHPAWDVPLAGARG